MEEWDWLDLKSRRDERGWSRGEDERMAFVRSVVESLTIMMKMNDDEKLP